MGEMPVSPGSLRWDRVLPHVADGLSERMVPLGVFHPPICQTVRRPDCIEVEGKASRLAQAKDVFEVSLQLGAVRPGECMRLVPDQNVLKMPGAFLPRTEPRCDVERQKKHLSVLLDGID